MSQGLMRSPAVLCALVWCRLLTCDAAQAQEPMRLPAFGEVVDVRAVDLEVVVTRHGNRVSGLGPEGFRLRVDGDEVPIEFFSEVSAGRISARSPASTGSSPAPGEVLGTRFLVFIDDDFSLPSYRNRVLSELADQVSLMRPEDRMAVVAFDGRRLTMLSSWTRSLARLKAVLTDAQERRAYGLLRRSQRWRSSTYGRFNPRWPRGTSFSSTGFLGLGRARAGSTGLEVLRYEDSGNQVARVVRAATSALRGFARPPGRKVLLLLAGGWQAHWHDADPYRRLAIERQLFAPLVDTANRLGYSLYPIDLHVDGAAGGVTSEPVLRGGARGGISPFERARRGQERLYYLARETGGRAFLGGATLTALERAIEDTRSYYWLGFTPTWQEDDSAHRIEVEMRQKGLQARARRSFSDLSRETEVSMWIESAHLFDAPLPEGGELSAELGRPQPAGSGKLVLPVRIEVPWQEVTLTPQGEGFATRLELRVAASDADGGIADLPVVPVELTLSDLPEPGQVGVYETRLKLRRKAHRLLIALFDPDAGRVLSKRIEFEP